jgi:hypothetical protein
MSSVVAATLTMSMYGLLHGKLHSLPGSEKMMDIGWGNYNYTAG